MARTKDTDLPRRRTKMGERLGKAIEDSNYKRPKPFLNSMKKKYGQKNDVSEDGYYLEGLDTLATLSRIINGHLTLQNRHAKMAAEMLNIDVNYLLGTVDDFKAESYDEYLELIKRKEGIEEDFRKSLKYCGLLALADYSVEYYDPDNDMYSIKHDNKAANNIPTDVLKAFEQDVLEFIDFKMQRIMSEHGCYEEEA